MRDFHARLDPGSSSRAPRDVESGASHRRIVGTPETSSSPANRRRRAFSRPTLARLARLALALACCWLAYAAVAFVARTRARLGALARVLAAVSDPTDLAELPGVREAVRELVASGALADVARETVQRAHLIPLGGGDARPLLGSAGVPRVDSPVYVLGVDVSRSGEATWVYDRFLRLPPREAASFERLVVDVGANDGFLSSNSYNLVRWGWSAVLVEPNPEMLALAKKAQDPLVRGRGFARAGQRDDPDDRGEGGGDVGSGGGGDGVGSGSDLIATRSDLIATTSSTSSDSDSDSSRSERRQRLCYVNAGMAGVETATTMRLRLGEDVVSMESALEGGGGAAGRRRRDRRDATLARLRGEAAEGGGAEGAEGASGAASGAASGGGGGARARVISVPVLPAAEVVRRCEVPRSFGLLSVDAEGVGDKVLREWLDAGFEPRWILYESMHNEEPFEETRRRVEARGYAYRGKIGWNRAFERTSGSSF